EKRVERLGRRGRTEPDDEIGPMCVDPRPGPREVIRVRQHERAIVRAAANPGQRVGSDRKAGCGGEPRDGRTEHRIVLRPSDDEAALAGGETVCHPLEIDVRELAPRRYDFGDHRVAPGFYGREGSEWHERLAERDVEMDRARRSASGRRN